jgi:hypothetical protein
MKPPSVQSPFARCPSWLHRGDVFRLLGRRYPSVLAPTGSCANPRPALPSFGLSLVRGVFTGCYQPRLRGGSSRRYLCESFLGCLVPYHGGITECIYLFLPPCHRPSPTEEMGRLTRANPRTRFFAERFSRLQTFLYVQASEFARLPGRSYRCSTCRRAAETFTSGQNVLRCLCTHRIC